MIHVLHIFLFPWKLPAEITIMRRVINGDAFYLPHGNNEFDQLNESEDNTQLLQNKSDQFLTWKF